MIIGDVTLAGEVFAGMLALGTLIFLGFAGWVGNMMVKASTALAAVQARLDAGDDRMTELAKRLDDHEARLRA